MLLKEGAMASKEKFLGAALLCSWVAACGGTGGMGAVTSDSGGTGAGGSSPGGSGTPIDFVPSAVHANRFPRVCGVANPPFMNGDLFSLDVVGAMNVAPDNALCLSFVSPAPPVGRPIALSVMAFTAQGIGIETPPSGPTTWYPLQKAAGGGVNFIYMQGNSPSEIDAGAFDSVIFTLVQSPSKDGDPFAVRLQIHFVDGKQLDDTFSSPLTTILGLCPAT
jgi:hypothetical protein